MSNKVSAVSISKPNLQNEGLASLYDYYKSIFENVPKPFAFVNLDFLENNIEAVRTRAGNKNIRLASKSIRCLPILRNILNSHSQFQGIMSYSPQEAVFLSGEGFDNILMGYPVWDESHLRAIAKEIIKGKNIVLMVDSHEHVEKAKAIARDLHIDFPLCIDLDMSSDFPGLHFGVWRSGINNKDKAVNLAKYILDSPSVKLTGIMGYESQIAGVGDKLEGQYVKSQLIRFLKRRSIKEIKKRREETVKALYDIAGDLELVNAGGTGSLESSIKEAGVTEVTVGSGFYSPTLFDQYADFQHQPAAAFALEVTRNPKKNIYTCLGGGYVASGATGKEKLPATYLPEGLELFPLEGAGEVQTPILNKGKQNLQIGDPVFFRHSKAGELCERFDYL
ncbi:alanine racemase, partial [Xanthovirga aplysinae]|uniref:alanine racemase n=1 Tax=Xanthovirga aplysinae TaxID=2529853 RepID=UPI001656EC60|nr:amino acid deaminase/aldolase [Xanthovirga aplysinae]